MASVLITELEAFVSRVPTVVHGAATQVLEFLKEEAGRLEHDLMAAKALLEANDFEVFQKRPQAVANSEPAPAA